MNWNNTHTRLYAIIGGILLLNIIGGSWFRRIDLTEERRYSLSEVSQNTALELEAPLYISIYLAGEFPANIRRFQDAIRTTLIEMDQYSAGYLNFEFIDPAENPELRETLGQRGFRPIPVQVQSSTTERVQKLMYPQALFRYGEREKYVDLLKGSTFPDGSIDFNKAESELEYKLISSIRAVAREQGGIVGILQGHGEPIFQNAQGRINPAISELGAALQNASYEIGLLDRALSEGMAFPPNIDVILVLQPIHKFSERDKYELDQYLLRGGSLLFVMDQQELDLDLNEKRSTLTDLHELNLDDLFMQAGFKLNYDLIQDLNSGKIEVFQEGPSGGRQFSSVPWLYNPMIFNLPDHPVSRNVDGVLMRYASSIDTFNRPGVKKGVFLQTSPQSRKQEGKIFIDFNNYIQNPPPPEIFNQGPFITGLVAEGQFKSVFTGRRPPVDSLSPEPPTVPFEAENRIDLPGKIAVIADGEFFLGENYRGKRRFIPADNITLLMNLIDYLAGDDALTQIRSKDLVIRNLDRDKVRNNLALIRGINLVLPIFIILLIGTIRYYLRKRRNERLQITEE